MEIDEEVRWFELYTVAEEQDCALCQEPTERRARTLRDNPALPLCDDCLLKLEDGIRVAKLAGDIEGGR
jgi:hypothetical protein